MSISSIETIIKRIESARPESRIAIFNISEKGKFDAVFADTIMTMRRIEIGDPDYLGSYCNNERIEARAAMANRDCLENA